MVDCQTAGYSETAGFLRVPWLAGSDGCRNSRATVARVGRRRQEVVTTAGCQAACCPVGDYYRQGLRVVDCRPAGYRQGRYLVGSPAWACCRDAPKEFRELADCHQCQDPAQAVCWEMTALPANRVPGGCPPRVIRGFGGGIGQAASVASYRRGWGKVEFAADFPASRDLVDLVYPAGDFPAAENRDDSLEAENRADESPGAVAGSRVGRVAGDMAAADKIREVADNTAGARDHAHSRK